MAKRKITTKIGDKVNELITKQEAALTAAAMDPTAWGKMSLTKNDLIIPWLQLTQPTSDIVTVQKKALPGEIRDSLNNSLLAKEGLPLEVIPFYVMKKFKVNKVIESKGKVKKEFLRMTPIQDNPTQPGFNDNLPWTDKEMIDGQMCNIENIRTYDVFLIVPSLGRDLAYVMSFSSTNTKAAKNMMLQMALNQEQGKTPAAYCFDLSIGTKSNDDSTWFVIGASLGREATEKEQGQAFKWYQRVQGGEARVHEEEIG